jgi:hypothetical protein
VKKGRKGNDEYMYFLFCFSTFFEGKSLYPLFRVEGELAKEVYIWKIHAYPSLTGSLQLSSMLTA